MARGIESGPRYRAIKLGPTRWGWHVQKKGWFWWDDVKNGDGHTEAEARDMLEFYAGAPSIIYPPKTSPSDPLGILDKE